MLSKKIASQTIFSFLQQIQKFVFVTVSNIILVNSIDRADYGMLGIVTSYFVVFYWLTILPEEVLLRDYKKIKTSKFKEYVSLLSGFGLIRTALLFFVSIFFGFILSQFFNNATFLFVFSLYALYQLSFIFSGSLQLVLRMEFKQMLITKVSFFIRVIQIFALLGLLVNQSLYYYLFVAILAIFAEIIFWIYYLKKDLGAGITLNMKILYSELKPAIASFAIWQHFSRNITKYIYEIDLVFLAFFVPLTVSGDYSLAIKISNYSIIIPSILQNSVFLALSRIDARKKANQVVNIFLRYSFFVSVFQLLVFLVLGRWYIFIHTRDRIDEIFFYALMIITGLSVFNITRPLMAYCISKTPIKKFFIYSSIPSVVFSSMAYYFSAKYFGADGVAIANITAYSFWMVTVVFYALRHGYVFKLVLLATEERELLLKYLRKFVKVIKRS